jgi:hypothetical protein
MTTNYSFRWLDHRCDPQEESREHPDPTEWSNKQRKDLTTHGESSSICHDM